MTDPRKIVLEQGRVLEERNQQRADAEERGKKTTPLLEKRRRTASNTGRRRLSVESSSQPPLVQGERLNHDRWKPSKVHVAGSRKVGFISELNVDTHGGVGDTQFSGTEKCTRAFRLGLTAASPLCRRGSGCHGATMSQAFSTVT